jgi:AraC-like DNA-binding protein
LSVMSAIQYKNGSARYEAKADTEIAGLVKNLRDKMFTYTSTGNSIFSSHWYSHYNTESDMYDNEFDYLKQMEITSELTSRIASLEYTYNILIITPNFDEVIHRVGWYSIKDYSEYYGDVSISSNSSEVTAKLQDDKYFMLQIPDPISRPNESIICILIDKNNFASYFEYLSLIDMEYIGIKSADQTLYESGNAEAKGYTAAETIYFNSTLDIKIVYLSFWAKSSSNIINQSLFLLMAVLLVSTLTSFLLTVKNVKPLVSLLNRFDDVSFTSSNDAYYYIDHYIDHVTTENLEMNEKNRTLNERFLNFFKTMRNELMLSMMINENFDFEDEYVKTNLPWIFKSLPFSVFFIHKDAEQKIKLPPRSFAHFQTFIIPPGELCLIIWFCDEKQAQLKLPSIREMVETQVADKGLVNVSPLLTNIQQMREYYRMLHHNNQFQTQMVEHVVKQMRRRRNDETIELIRNYIDEGYSDPRMSIKLLESIFDLDGSFISKKFKAAIGMTFSEYLQECRIAKAMRLLETTYKNLCNIAEDVGYINYATFKRAFIRLRGVSPKKYREKYKQ